MSKEEARRKILGLLFRFPSVEFSLRELAEKSKVPLSTSSSVVETLNKEGILKKAFLERANISRISANIESKKFLSEKRLNNIRELLLSGIIEKLERIYGHPKCIILYGSYLQGTDDINSDIDIAVQREFGARLESKETNLIDAEAQKKLKRKLHILEFMIEKIDKYTLNTLANGFVISGSLVVKE